MNSTATWLLVPRLFTRQAAINDKSPSSAALNHLFEFEVNVFERFVVVVMRGLTSGTSKMIAARYFAKDSKKGTGA